MLEGLMQDAPLTLQLVLARMRELAGDREVVTAVEGGRERARYAEVGERIDRLCAGLAALGVEPGDRVATFAWNTQRHLEAYLGVPCMGAVLHTLNVRLFADQLVYVVDHAQDRVILVDGPLVGRLAELAPRLSSVRRYVVMGDGDLDALPNAIAYEELLAAQAPGFAYPRLDERAAAGLCYTSGTTGRPKGVLYSHRSNVLHTLGQCVADGPAYCQDDRVMPVVPMFHANAWGIPYAAAMVGADLILPGPFLTASALVELMQAERVTATAGVPTIWMDVLRYADEHKPDLSSLRLITCGGATVPRWLMQAYEERHGLLMLQAWGMTETSPLGSTARPPAGVEPWAFRDTAGRLMPLVEGRVVDDDGRALPRDGRSTGELQVRGPWIAGAYYGDPSAHRFDGEWLRTGDVASIDERGYIRIADRAKDVIKSGGKWISSVQVETELMDHPDVIEAAVIAMPHERWQERPLACVVVRPGASVTAVELRDHLRDRMLKWWIPDAFAFVDEVPKTSVGKFDKKLLRRRLAEGSFHNLAT